MGHERSKIADLIKRSGFDLAEIAAASGVPIGQVYIAAQGGPLNDRTCDRIAHVLDDARFRIEVWQPVHDALARYLDAPDLAKQAHDHAGLLAAGGLRPIIDGRNTAVAAIALILLAVATVPGPHGQNGQ